MAMAEMLVVAMIAIAAAPSNPLARAEAGELQCYRPDVAKRTCQSIASYDRTGPGTYDNKALVALSNEATLETHTPVVLRGDAVCGYIRAQDILAGTARSRGSALAPDVAKGVLEKLAQTVAPFAGKEICTRYVPSSAALVAKVSIAGSYRPDQDIKVKWIGASDGYSVTP
jgi:hypothetical protein